MAFRPLAERCPRDGKGYSPVHQAGHSLCWCGRKGTAELWGLDLSVKQIANAQTYLTGNGFRPRLFNAPMEQECGLPKGYFEDRKSVV